MPVWLSQDSVSGLGHKHGSTDHAVCAELSRNLPWSNAFGVGQGVARDGLAAKAQVIKVLALHAQIDLDIAQ